MLSFKKENIIKFIGCIVFVTVLFKTFCNVTYLFRDVGYNRNHMVGIENEDGLDMVYIGGSATYLYWEPLKAWNDCGFTSYSYTTQGIQAENIKAYIKNVRKSQNPELFVIDVRPFQYYSDEQDEAGLRRGTDGMNITSAARYELISDYFSNRNTADDTDILSYYLDITKYHTNTVNLGSDVAWGFVNNDGISPNKGWEWRDVYEYLEDPTDFYTEKRAELIENSVEILKDLLSYCKEEKLNVLFVVCPYHITEEDQSKYNTIGDIVEGYGFNYLNANEYYKEMELDFTTDFSDRVHANLFGAAKYTRFLENYMLDKYDMPDHRGEEAYSSWDEDYQRFREEEKEHAKAVTDLQLDVEKGKEIAKQMRQVSNLSEWNDLAEDARFTLFIETTGDFEWPQNLAAQRVLNMWGIEQADTNVIRIVSGSDIIYSNNEDGAVVRDGEIVLDEWEQIIYHLSVEDGNCFMTINGDDMAMEQSGINVVVVDNNYRKVVDQVVIRCDENGDMCLDRE